jgi:haloacetate dehalogenase
VTPGAIASSCADFRAMMGPDLVQDEESIAAGQKVECPVLILYGTGSPADLVAIWQLYAPDGHGQSMPTGHFVPEEALDLVTAALRDFLD